MKQVTLLLRSFSHHEFRVRTVTRAGLGDAEEAAAAASVCQQLLPSLPSQHTSAPQQEPHSSLPNQQNGEPEIYALRDFYVLSRRAAEGKLHHSQKPPSVSLFIRAGKAVYSVSGWKLHWDCSLIVLFVELIALFDRPFSCHAWEWNGFAAMWEWRGLELFLLAASMQQGRGDVLGYLIQILLQRVSREVKHAGNRVWTKGREACGCIGCLVSLSLLFPADPCPAKHPGSVCPRRELLSRLALP